VGGARDLGKRVLPDGLVAWYRRVRRKTLRVFGGPVTPVSLVKVAGRKSGMTRLVRGVALKVLPYETTERIRRRRLMRGYLAGLSHELVPDERETATQPGSFTRRDAFYARVVHEDLERMDAGAGTAGTRAGRARGGGRKVAPGGRLSTGGGGSRQGFVPGGA
jgi:hypothetical protein